MNWKKEAINLESIQKYGEHTYIVVGCDDTNYHNVKIGNLKQNYDFSVTIDVANVLNPNELIQKVSGYGVNIAITERVSNLPPNLPIILFEYDYEYHEEFLILRYGNSTRRLFPKKLYEHLVEVYFGSVKNYNYEKHLKLWTNFSTHKELGRNIFVTDNSEIHLIKHQLIKNRSMMIVKSEEVIPIIKCMHRHFGKYYAGRNFTLSKGLYYWDLLHRELPNYEKIWGIAVYGNSEKYFNLTKSLGDRCMSLLEILDDIKYLYLDDPNNEAEWSSVNKLNYFVILFTGVLDNLAHLTSCQYAEKNFGKMDIILRTPKKEKKENNKFQKYIEKNNKELWELIESFQEIIEIIYPIRDTVQHRGFLSSAVIEDIRYNWKKVMIKVDEVIVSAIKCVDEVQHQKMNNWGLFVIEEKNQLIEPFTFTKKATSELFSFINEYLYRLYFNNLNESEIC